MCNFKSGMNCEKREREREREKKAHDFLSNFHILREKFLNNKKFTNLSHLQSVKPKQLVHS